MWDKAIMKAVTERKVKLMTGKDDKDVTKPLFTEKDKDMNIYQTSIEMLKQLPKVETPRAKKLLVNEAINLVEHALLALKGEVGADLDDYIFSFLMYYAS